MRAPEARKHGTVETVSDHTDTASPNHHWFQHYNAWTSRTIDLDSTQANPRGRTLPAIFANARTEFADRTAYSFFGKKTTYEEYGAAVDYAAAALRSLGARRGDHIAIVSPNCPQALIAFYATLSIGAVPVLHNPLYTAHELQLPFQDHAARIAFFWDKSADVAETLRRSTPLDTVVSITLLDEMPLALRLALKLPLASVRSSRDKLTGAAPHALPWKHFLAKGRSALGKNPGSGKEPAQGSRVHCEGIDPQDPALILYTSGTTGEPKGAVLTHRNLIANLQQGLAWVDRLGQREEPELMLAALPLFHAYGLTMNITMAPLIGGELILLPAPEMDLIMKELKKRTPTWLPGVPALYEKIMDSAQEHGVSLSGIRCSFSGASALSAATTQRWEKLTDGTIIEGYGLSETSPIIVGNPMGRGREGYIGVPFPDTDVRIVNPDNPSEVVPTGQAGELLARGPQVFKGYLNKPEATAAAFHDGWFRTGDMAVMEEDGFIRIAARIKEMIITGGFNVYPAEVEEVLSSHEAIAQASVVGLAKEDGSEEVVAAVVLAAGSSLDLSPESPDTQQLRDFAAARLTRYKVPRRFFICEELPVDQMGKVRRREVHALLEAESAEEAQAPTTGA